LLPTEERGGIVLARRKKEASINTMFDPLPAKRVSSLQPLRDTILDIRNNCNLIVETGLFV
jgi:hypothetical protein